MSIGIKPLGARVVIKRSEALEKTEGGLILSASAKEIRLYSLSTAAQSSSMVARIISS